MNFGQWERFRAEEPFHHSDSPSFAGISGGRTSAMMASLLDERVWLCFENTGREDERTLVFLKRLEDALKREIVWLEWRPPVKRGAPPKDFTFERVTFDTATRGPDLFEGLLAALADYRREKKGLGPVVPWPRSRICTAYLKHRTQRAFMRSLGVDDKDVHDEYVGLRADEPGRAERLRSRETQARSFRLPLSEAGITKQDVNRFWSQQSFDLELDHDRQGNCGACFLKDHADISRVLGEPQTDGAWWVDLERRYPGFGGKNFPGYAQLLKERPVRLSIEAALKEGKTPVDDGTLTPRRFKLVVANERRYLDGEREAFSCACESSFDLEVE